MVDEATAIHPSHKIVEHTRKGLYCTDCQAYTYGKNPENLNLECPGPVDVKNLRP